VNYLLARGHLLAARSKRMLAAIPGLRRAVRALRRREYSKWREAVEPGAADLRRMREQAQRLGSSATRIAVIMPVYNPVRAHLEAAIASVVAQAWPHWQLCICNDASGDPQIRALLDAWAAREPRIQVTHLAENRGIALATAAALTLADSPFVGFLDHDDCLAPWALYFVARTIAAQPQLDILYSDEDKLDTEDKRRAPHFKPDWNPELFHAVNYLCHMVVLRRALVEAVGGMRAGFDGAQDYDLLLRCVAATSAERIAHIPAVLYHWRESATSTANSAAAKPYAHAAGVAALKSRFAAVSAVVDDGLFPTSYRLRYPLPVPAPRISILIPTRDGHVQLRRCIDSIRRLSDGHAFELLILNNQSRDPATLEYLAQQAQLPGTRVLDYDQPFNYSAINNFGAQHAQGDVLLLLNDDVEVLRAGWLDEMLGRLMQPGVGVVGAKLYYPDGRLQHAGVILGIGGVAGHSHKFFAGDDPGYYGRLQLPQTVSAVTGACLMVRRAVYQAVGGLDAEQLPIAYNDVDLCLRIGASGLRCVWTPYAELVHHESLSRGAEDTPDKLARLAREARVMTGRWGAQLLRDPAYNPNLSLAREDFSLASEPESWLQRLARVAPSAW
jgi:GT2 family glycosyltransferase